MVKCDTECRQFVLVHVLKLVDEHGQSGVGAHTRLSDSPEERLEVQIEVSVVGETRLRVKVESDLYVMVLHLERTGETSQPPKRPPRQFPPA